MKEFQQRVIDEKKALDEKIDKLTQFIPGEIYEKLPVDEQVRLKLQLHYMHQYSKVLGERINWFDYA